MRFKQEYIKLSDEALMEIFVKHQDKAAFICLYKRYFVPLSKYIAWLSNDWEQGRDIAQNIFLKVYQKPSLFDSLQNFKIWLFSIAKNRWKNELRNATVRSQHRLLASLETEKVLPEYEIEETNKNRIKLDQIQLALEDLSEAHKEVFVLKYLNNLTIKEISEICECSEGTVKSRLFYALKKLKENLNVSITKEL